MNKQLKLIGVYLYTLFFSPAVMAVDAKLTVSVPSFPPFYFADTNRPAACQGVAIEILSLLTEALEPPLKRDVDIVNYPYARILHTLKMGKLDLALIFKNEALAQDVYFIGPVSKSKVIILTNASHFIKQYADLATLSAIAVIRNASFEQHFDHDDTLSKVKVDSYIQALKMFNHGRVDAIVGSIVGLEYASTIQKVNIEQLNVFQLGEKEWWLHLSKKSRYVAKRQQLARAANKIYQDDLVAQIYQQQMQQCSGY